MPRRVRSRSPRKARLGQNFLVSPSGPRLIVDALGEIAGAIVLEIGAGKGAVTSPLAGHAQHLIAVELDRSLAEELERKFAATPSIEILSRDILTVDLTALAQRVKARLLVVGNLPYYITSPILLHLFAHSPAIERAVLMVQREVADRIAAAPGSSNYGLLSATTQMYARVETLFTLPPEAFSPPPEVHSTVLRLTMQPRFANLGVAPEAFLHFLRQAFALKRKTMANNLRAAGYRDPQIQSAFAECNLDPRIRAEALSLVDMARLFQTLTTDGQRLTTDGPAASA